MEYPASPFCWRGKQHTCHPFEKSPLRPSSYHLSCPLKLRKNLNLCPIKLQRYSHWQQNTFCPLCHHRSLLQPLALYSQESDTSLCTPQTPVITHQVPPVTLATLLSWPKELGIAASVGGDEVRWSFPFPSSLQVAPLSLLPWQEWGSISSPSLGWGEGQGGGGGAGGAGQGKRKHMAGQPHDDSLQRNSVSSLSDPSLAWSHTYRLGGEVS